MVELSGDSGKKRNADMGYPAWRVWSEREKTGRKDHTGNRKCTRGPGRVKNFPRELSPASARYCTPVGSEIERQTWVNAMERRYTRWPGRIDRNQNTRRPGDREISVGETRLWLSVLPIIHQTLTLTQRRPLVVPPMMAAWAAQAGGRATCAPPRHIDWGLANGTRDRGGCQGPLQARARRLSECLNLNGQRSANALA